MPSHATIKFCSTPQGVLVAESVADGAMGGNFASHRSDAASFFTEGVKAGDFVIPVTVGLIPTPPTGLTVT